MTDDPFRPLGGASRARARGVDTTKVEWTVLSPVPKNAPPAPDTHPRHGKATRVEAYRNKRGDLDGYVCRFDPAGREKVYLPLTYCRNASSGELSWRWQSWPAPRPLYGRDRLEKRPNAKVVVCEGEKAADAAASLLPDYVCVTSPNGAQSAGKADWSPLYRRDGPTRTNPGRNSPRRLRGCLRRSPRPSAGSSRQRG